MQIGTGSSSAGSPGQASNKWTETVAKLNALTRAGKLKWQVHEPDPPLLKGRGEKIEQVYKTRIKDRIIRIYTASYFLRQRTSRTEFEYEIVLDFCDGDGQSLQRFPDMPGIHELFEAVQQQSTDIDGFLDDFF